MHAFQAEQLVIQLLFHMYGIRLLAAFMRLGLFKYTVGGSEIINDMAQSSFPLGKYIFQLKKYLCCALVVILICMFC